MNFFAQALHDAADGHRVPTAAAPGGTPRRFSSLAARLVALELWVQLDEDRPQLLGERVGVGPVLRG